MPEALNFANGLFRERRYELAAKEYERFLGKDAQPGSAEAAEARFGLANARLFQGEYAKARKEFEAFLRDAPDHPNAGTARYRVGETAYMLGDLPAARQAFETFTNDFPGHKHRDTAWPYLGDVCLRIGDLAKARQAYERSLAEHPQGRLADRARFGQGRVLALQGEDAAAQAVFEKLAELGGKDWADRAWFQLGQLHAKAGRDEQAVAAYAKVEAAAPQSPLVPEARLNRAEVLAKLGRNEEAEALFRGLLKDGPQNLAAQAAFQLGTALLARNEAAEALEVLDDAAQKHAQSPMASALKFRSAEAALQLNRPDDAQARFLEAAAADPKDPWADDAQARAARLALDRRDYAAATKLAEDFLAKFPDSPLKADARLVQARAAQATDKPKEAIAILTASLAEDQPSPATAEALRYYLGLAYREAGQGAKAVEILDELAKTPAAPIAADAQFMVGQGNLEAKRFAEAIPALEKYLETKADGEVADYALAYLVQAHLELKGFGQASQALERLARQFPKSKTLPASRIRLGEAALAADQFGRAADEFSKAAAEAKEGGTAPEPALFARAQLGLGWAKLDGREPVEAAEAFQAYLKAMPDAPLAPEAAFALGRALDAAGQRDAALEAFGQAADKYAKTDFGPLAALARARLLVAAEKPTDAAEAYAKFVADHPDYKPKEPGAPGLDAILADWGWSLIDAGKPAEADKVFARLLDEFPASPHADDARFNLAESANQAKNLDEVVKLLEPLVRGGGQASPRLLQSALYRLGRTYAEKKDWEAAARTIDRLIQEHAEGPLKREALLLRAEIALESGDAGKSEEILSALQSAPADPKDPPGFPTAVSRRRVQALLALKKWDEVIKAASAIRAETPDDPAVSEADYARGRALQALARFDEARAAFNDVIDGRKSGDLAARAQLMIGETYFHQKDYHEAIRQFLKVDILYDAPPWQAAALLETGKAHEQLAQWADAAETYERLRAKFPDDERAAEAKTRLEAIKNPLAGGPA